MKRSEKIKLLKGLQQGTIRLDELRENTFRIEVVKTGFRWFVNGQEVSSEGYAMMISQVDLSRAKIEVINPELVLHKDWPARQRI